MLEMCGSRIVAEMGGLERRGDRRQGRRLRGGRTRRPSIELGVDVQMDQPIKAEGKLAFYEEEPWEGRMGKVPKRGGDRGRDELDEVVSSLVRSSRGRPSRRSLRPTSDPRIFPGQALRLAASLQTQSGSVLRTALQTNVTPNQQETRDLIELKMSLVVLVVQKANERARLCLW